MNPVSRRTTARRLRTTLAAITGAWACEGDPDTPPFAIRDSAGVSIVENASPRWRAGEEWRLDARPLVDIGGASLEEAYDLFQVVSAVRLSDGSIVVANSGSHELRLYSPDGTYERAAGRQGDGPGEFQGLSWMKRLPGDSLITFDQRQLRYSVFDGGGTFTRSIRLQTTTDVPFAIAVDMFSDGSFLTQGFASTGNETPSGLQRHEVPLYRFAADGASHTEFGMFSGVETYFESIPGGFRFREAFFPRRTLRRAVGDRLCIATSDTYEVRCHSLDGTLSTIIRRTHAPVAVTQQHLTSERERRLAVVETDADRQTLALVLDQIPVPETFPAYRRVLVDDGLNLWVQEYPLPGDAAAIWSVFDSNGVWLGRLEGPLGFEPYAGGSDFLLGVWKDADEVEHVRLYRLVKP